MTKRFEKAYNALVKAFFDGTLAKGNCTCCVVGNIIADAQGGKITIYKNNRDTDVTCTTFNSRWEKLFMTYDGKQRISRNFDIEREIFNLTNYTANELAQVECAFETNTLIELMKYHEYTEQEILEDQYNGLCAVFEVLCELDSVKVDYRSKLQEKENLILSY